MIRIRATITDAPITAISGFPLSMMVNNRIQKLSAQCIAVTIVGMKADVRLKKNNRLT